ncbi:CobW family GTP-binding protein [Mesobacillus zeae]|uniref:CobW family GTP-binding protein n=1 Tax=Mesobacillus zeae TaxID=1917180 RepID=UPI00300A91EB
MPKTEIYILAGFLGTGKTTLLKELLTTEHEEGRKVAVLMNELGEISIDSDEIDDTVPLKELLGGCICCTLQDKLESQLQEILKLYQPDAIYIETTGAAHPVEVLDAVLSPLFADLIEMKGIVTTVDGTLWKERAAMPPQIQQLLLEQVRFADLIVVNKTDMLSDFEQGKLCMEIQSLNAAAPCILTSFSRIPAKKIRNLSVSAKEGAEAAHVHAGLGLSTFVYRFSARVSQSGFEDFLRGLPDGMFRIKGYIHFSHADYPDLFQYSYGTTLYMRECMNLPLNLVFIGHEIDWKEILQKLEQLEGRLPEQD